jgi:anhydro-N-acetylmuramic acid kinase
VHEKLLARMLAEPYFSLAAPKSTGRDRFNPDWLQRAIDAADDGGDRGDGKPGAADVQATLVELAAITIARACADYGVQAAYACGGGTRNTFLMERLAARLSPTPLQTTAVLRIDPQAVEAAAFAWLAAQRVDAKAGNLSAVTGARGPRVLGAISDPRVARG